MNIVYNWHMTEKCNYSCQYCFAHWTQHPHKEIWHDKTTVYRILKEMKTAENSTILLPLKQDKQTVNTRINFAGGEPLLLGKTLIDFACKAREFGLKTSMISNGSLLLRFKEIARYMDTIGISIDSLVSETNQKIGRQTKNGKSLNQSELSDIILALKKENPDVQIKFNIVVNRYNYQENIVSSLLKLNPEKIKIFRELPFGENQAGITDEMFQHFLNINSETGKSLYIEDNSAMTHSYLMIDPFGRFFQNGNQYDYNYSDPIQDIGFEKALNSIAFDANEYLNRYKIGDE
jgi:radical S-adenosyl methionine domain-containing protein 2